MLYSLRYFMSTFGLYMCEQPEEQPGDTNTISIDTTNTISPDISTHESHTPLPPPTPHTNAVAAATGLHHTFYGFTIHYMVAQYMFLMNPTIVPLRLEDQEQGNGDGGIFPQPWEVDRPPPHPL